MNENIKFFLNIFEAFNIIPPIDKNFKKEDITEDKNNWPIKKIVYIEWSNDRCWFIASILFLYYWDDFRNYILNKEYNNKIDEYLNLNMEKYIETFKNKNIENLKKYLNMFIDNINKYIIDQINEYKSEVSFDILDENFDTKKISLKDESELKLEINENINDIINVFTNNIKLDYFHDDEINDFKKSFTKIIKEIDNIQIQRYILVIFYYLFNNKSNTNDDYRKFDEIRKTIFRFYEKQIYYTNVMSFDFCIEDTELFNICKNLVELLKIDDIEINKFIILYESKGLNINDENKKKEENNNNKIIINNIKLLLDNLNIFFDYIYNFDFKDEEYIISNQDDIYNGLFENIFDLHIKLDIQDRNGKLGVYDDNYEYNEYILIDKKNIINNDNDLDKTNNLYNENIKKIFDNNNTNINKNIEPEIYKHKNTNKLYVIAKNYDVNIVNDNDTNQTHKGIEPICRDGLKCDDFSYKLLILLNKYNILPDNIIINKLKPYFKFNNKTYYLNIFNWTNYHFNLGYTIDTNDEKTYYFIDTLWKGVKKNINKDNIKNEIKYVIQI